MEKRNMLLYIMDTYGQNQMALFNFRFDQMEKCQKEFKCEEDESTPVDCGTLLLLKVGLVVG